MASFVISSSSSSSFFFLFLSLSSLLTPIQSDIDICLPSFYYNSNSAVNFPFRLKTFQNQRCGYNTSFDLSLNNQNQTVLNLPNLGGDFIVQSINYLDQNLRLRDPDDCFIRRLLSSTYNSDYSPFRAVGTKSFTFLNCSRQRLAPGELEPYEPVSCLSGVNHTVVRVEEESYNGSWSKCKAIRTVAAPLIRPSTFDLDRYDEFWLAWDVPNCGSCAARGGACGFKSGSDTEVGCMLFIPPPTGLPRSAKYGIIVGVGIPVLLCLIGLGCFICSKINYYAQRRRQHEAVAVFSIPTMPQPWVVEMGLDKPTIESYPKTELGKSCRLPKPNDTTCSICLSDYQPSETIRTIPECGHYFHIDCIDEWLKMKGTCPLCRNSPEVSTSTTFSSTPSSSSLSPVSSG